MVAILRMNCPGFHAPPTVRRWRQRDREWPFELRKKPAPTAGTTRAGARWTVGREAVFEAGPTLASWLTDLDASAGRVQSADEPECMGRGRHAVGCGPPSGLVE
jgi:hypothetical protein